MNFDEYFNEFKEEIQTHCSENWNEVYNEILMNEGWMQSVRDNWSNNDMDPSEMAESVLKWRNDTVQEDFTMGVEGPLGLNQGIPHGGPGKGVLPKPLYNPNAKAVPPKKKDDEDTEKNKKEMEKSLKKPVTEAIQIADKLEDYIGEVSGEMIWLFDQKDVPGPDRDKYYDALDDDLEVEDILIKNYKDGIDEESTAEEIIKFLDKKFTKPKKPKLSKTAQLFIKRTDGSVSRLQFVTLAETLDENKLIDIVNTYTSDWTELWTERYELDDEGYSVRAIESKRIPNPKRVVEHKANESTEMIGESYTVDDVDHELDRLGFDGDEIDDIISCNMKLIEELLAKGYHPARIVQDLDV